MILKTTGEVSLQKIQKLLWKGRLLTIALPKRYENDKFNSVPFHTVIVQDGSYLFDKLVNNYPSNVMFVGVEPIERNREYTPWIEDVSGQHYGGEAEQYLDLLEFELIPYLKEKYHIFDKSAYLTIGGGSFGALLSIYALVTRPYLFGKYLLMSTSMWYPGFIDFLKKVDNIKYPRDVYWYVGELEGAGYSNILENMVPCTKEGVEILEEKLINPQSRLTFTTHPKGVHCHYFFEKYFTEGINKILY